MSLQYLVVWVAGNKLLLIFLATLSFYPAPSKIGDFVKVDEEVTGVVAPSYTPVQLFSGVT